MRDKGNGGQPPALPPQDRAKLEDLAKQLKIRPEGGNGDDPFKLPKFDPNTKLPPFDPKNPHFDPKRFPAIDPDNPPEFDPKTKFPLDPDTGRPFDPRNGKPIDPKNPPKIDPVEPPPPPPMFDPRPKVDPMNPPPIDPKTGRPMEMNPPDDKRRFDPDNPLGAPKDSPEKLAKSKAAEAATALWEKNVGPIEESPAVKRAIIDLINDTEAMDALTDGKGNNLFDLLSKDGPDEGLGKLFDDGGEKWEWPKFDMNWSRGRNWDLDIGRPRDRELQYARLAASSPQRVVVVRRAGQLQLRRRRKSRGSSCLILLALVAAAVVWWKWGAIFLAEAGRGVGGRRAGTVADRSA